MNENKSVNRIVVVEMLYPKGHRSLDNKIISILSKRYNLLVLNYNYYFSCEGVEEINLPIQFLSKRIEALKVILYIINIILVKYRLRNTEFSTLLFMSINNKVSKYLNSLFPGKRIFVIHHNDIDTMIEYNNGVCLYSGMNDIKHIVFGDFIKEKLCEHTKCNPEDVYSVHHPITLNISDEIICKKNRTVVGLGLSNDEDFINQCIRYDSQSDNVLDYRIVLRSKVSNYDGNNLTVFTGFLDQNKYNEYFESASAVVLYYPSKFQYRYSGTLINAIANTCCILINDMPLSKYEGKNYPNLIKIIKTPDDLFNLSDDLNCSHSQMDERNKFLIKHSDINVLSDFIFLNE